MAIKTRHHLTTRDHEILTALDRTPLSAGQLLTLSCTFATPFGSLRMVRERLQSLCSAGWVRSARYATTSQGAGQNYYRLSRTGYGILYGERAAPPTKRYFSPLSLARQHHTRSLADFIVHTIVTAHRGDIAFTDFYRENTLRLTVGSECLYPDCSFQLVMRDGRTFNYFVEVDNFSERIRSMKDADSWQRKIRLYEDLQSGSPSRFRVLVVPTRSSVRLHGILALAATLASNPQRSLFLGVPLPDYLSESDALTAPIFLDHHRRAVSLLPAAQSSAGNQNVGAASEALQAA
ncbi:MAG: replication-relaxation family protein [Pirellulales bacterium]